MICTDIHMTEEIRRSSDYFAFYILQIIQPLITHHQPSYSSPLIFLPLNEIAKEQVWKVNEVGGNAAAVVGGGWLAAFREWKTAARLFEVRARKRSLHVATEGCRCIEREDMS